MSIKLKMCPHPDGLQGINGIEQVIMAYAKYLPAYGVEIVGPNATSFDLIAGHVGQNAIADVPYVCHLHGLYWTADYPGSKWQYALNAIITNAIRKASLVTVPSAWVAETFQHDMHYTPEVVPHGIDWDVWQNGAERLDYVLYNKNRQGDVCDAEPVSQLAQNFPQTRFLTTFCTRQFPNIKATGVLPHAKMKACIQRAGVYLATTKETFGIGILEAMASGVPVLGYAQGGILDLVEHGVNGYLAKPNDLADLVKGLHYCQEHNQTLGENGCQLARAWTWEKVCAQVALIYACAMVPDPPTAAIIIPTYNYAHLVGRAVQAARNQDYEQLVDIIVVDDGSNDDPQTALAEHLSDSRVRYLQKDNGGVATARNTGIAATSAKYITCLDADDEMAPNFLSTLIPALENDRALGVVYSGLKLIYADGTESIGKWPAGFDYDQQVKEQNQVPTCNVFRRALAQRLGGYRQRYAPHGCGTEDAEFWLRMGSVGAGAAQVTTEPLFWYHLGGKSNEHPSTNWTSWHPWTQDGLHPFASIATPKAQSHPVRQYDVPIVSVVIPVGPGHESNVTEALDSLEAQTMRQWEAIVVWDNSANPWDGLMQAYPFVKLVHPGTSPFKAYGAGYSRNLGAQKARAPFLLFLDADDWLLPHALETMLLAFNDTESVIYTDSLGVRSLDEKQVADYRQRDEVLDYVNGTALLRQPAADYDYQQAVRQPFTTPPYFWCYVTSLIPTAWHNELGGFDENMEAWEDWDYWIRAAKMGKPFTHVPETCITYSYDGGYRRQHGQTIKTELREYLTMKHKELKTMPCPGCGKSRHSPARRVPVSNDAQRSIENMNDNDLVLIEYTSARRGSHGVVGTTGFQNRIAQNMRYTKNGWVFDYGYHSPGHQFLVHKRDVATMPNVFRPVSQTAPERVIKLPTVVAAPPSILAPKPIVYEAPPTPQPFDLQTIPGITAVLAAKLEDAGYTDIDTILAAGDKLQKISGIGPAKAAAIRSAASALAPTQDSAKGVLAEIERILGA